MKFLCFAYGDEDGWNSLSDSEKQEALAHDVVIRARARGDIDIRPLQYAGDNKKL